jgi:NADH dehydrogenase (ubiquinone) 1 beta subcomplex subunit 9
MTWWYSHSDVFRYEAVLLRQRFEENRDIKDVRIAEQLLESGEQELFKKQHYQPKKCEYNDKNYRLFSIGCYA